MNPKNTGGLPCLSAPWIDQVCGRVKVVYFTPQLYLGVRAELLG